MEGKTARGASSPANPALHIPDPLSTTRACTSSSAILINKSFEYYQEKSEQTLDRNIVAILLQLPFVACTSLKLPHIKIRAFPYLTVIG
jgi:hypothetical protein